MSKPCVGLLNGGEIPRLDGHTIRLLDRFSLRDSFSPVSNLPIVSRTFPNLLPEPDEIVVKALQRANTRSAFILRLAAEYGLRSHDVAKVNRADVIPDLLGRSLNVVGKGDYSRLIPLPGAFADQPRP